MGRSSITLYGTVNFDNITIDKFCTGLGPVQESQSNERRVRVHRIAVSGNGVSARCRRVRWCGALLTCVLVRLRACSRWQTTRSKCASTWWVVLCGPVRPSRDVRACHVWSCSYRAHAAFIESAGVRGPKAAFVYAQLTKCYILKASAAGDSTSTASATPHRAPRPSAHIRLSLCHAERPEVGHRPRQAGD